MLTLKRLPENRGSFVAKTEKKARMFVYQVSGDEELISKYKASKEAEGYQPWIDPEFGPLYTTSINLGREAKMGFNNDGKPFAFNQKIKEALELKGQVSDSTVDKMIIEAMNTGSFATKLATVMVDSGDISNV